MQRSDKPTLGLQAEIALARMLTAPPEVAGKQAEARGLNQLFHFAQHHRLLPLLWHKLAPTAATWPEEIQGQWQRQVALQALVSGVQVRLLEELTPRWAEQGIRVVPLKGPVLGERLHGAARLRPSDDLDLLVAAGDLDGATTILEGLGFRGPDAALRNYQRRHRHHWSFVRGPLEQVELHFRLFAGFGITIPSEPVLHNAIPWYSSTGLATHVLLHEEELHYLAIHAAGHACYRLLWLYDLHRFLERHPDLRWDVVMARARATRTERAFRFALDEALLRSLVAPYWQSSAKPGMASQLANWIHGLEPHTRRFTLGHVCLHALLADSWSRGLRDAAHHVTHVAQRRLARWFPQLTPAPWRA